MASSRQELDHYTSQGLPLVFYDAALIFEKNLVSQFDEVVVVYTLPETQDQAS